MSSGRDDVVYKKNYFCIRIRRLLDGNKPADLPRIPSPPKLGFRNFRNDIEDIAYRNLPGTISGNSISRPKQTIVMPLMAFRL